jgi:hypothetical protein
VFASIRNVNSFLYHETFTFGQIEYSLNVG